ncbi:MAG: single-stranded DNA-binding protein [Erysipelotrichaceae bacterium]|nr:single-stranded DNA-binding protein [Erysipelotrichaceae bacterium]
MINNVVLVGRITRDPELRSTASGSSVTSFTVACDRGYNSADGQTADFISCVAWNKTAENIAKYCGKGSLVGVEGRIQTRNYENNQGQRVYVTEVYCNRVQFLESKAMREQQRQQRPQVPQDNFYDVKTMNNDIDLDNSFDSDDSFDSFDVMDDDIQF